LKPLNTLLTVQLAHAAAECITQTETPNPNQPPYHPANQQNPIANPQHAFTTCISTVACMRRWTHQLQCNVLLRTHHRLLTYRSNGYLLATILWDHDSVLIRHFTSVLVF